MSDCGNRRQPLAGARPSGFQWNYWQQVEIPMTTMWIILAFWAGAAIGFGTFAALQVSREQEERHLRRDNEYRFSAGC
jgi:hypothetical protein